MLQNQSYTITFLNSKDEPIVYGDEEALLQLQLDGWTLQQDQAHHHNITEAFYDAYKANNEVGMLTALQEIDAQGNPDNYLEHLQYDYEFWLEQQALAALAIEAQNKAKQNNEEGLFSTREEKEHNWEEEAHAATYVDPDRFFPYPDDDCFFF